MYQDVLSKNIVYDKNGNPAFTGNEDTTTPPTAFEFIPTGNLNEYLIRKYDEDKYFYVQESRST